MVGETLSCGAESKRTVCPARGRVGLLAAFLLVCLVLPARGQGTLEQVLALYEQSAAEKFPDIPEVDAPEAMAWIDTAAVTLVDVRAPRERAVSQIPGAIPEAVFEQRLDEFEGRPVLFYCTIGYRSGLATKRWRRRGIEAFNLRGGILAWTHAAGPLVDPNGKPTRRVHVYGKRWNLLPPGWEPLW